MMSRCFLKQDFFAKCFSNDAGLKEPEELNVKKIFRKIMLLSSRYLYRGIEAESSPQTHVPTWE